MPSRKQLKRNARKERRKEARPAAQPNGSRGLYEAIRLQGRILEWEATRDRLLSPDARHSAQTIIDGLRTELARLGVPHAVA